MEHSEHNIPSRASPRAPPPPRALPTPPPTTYKERQPKPKKQKTRAQLGRSQIKTSVVVIILLVLYLITLYLAFIIYTTPFHYNMASNLDQYDQTFVVPDLMSQEIPVKIEVTTSNDVECLLIKEKDYSNTLNINELRNLALNDLEGKNKTFLFQDNLKPGEYSIVVYAEDNDKNIEIDYEITRYFLIPFLGVISLLFILPLIIGLIWIVVLQRRKSSAPIQGEPSQGYNRKVHYPGEYEQYNDNHGQDGVYGGHGYEQDLDREDWSNTDADYPRQSPRSNTYPIYHPPPRRQPRGTQRMDRHEMNYRHRRTSADVDVNSNFTPPGYAPPRRPGGPQEQPVVKWEPEEEKSTTTVPCKCGEIIVINDKTRPLRIKCPRCGRRGVLEGPVKSDEDDVFY